MNKVKATLGSTLVAAGLIVGGCAVDAAPEAAGEDTAAATACKLPKACDPYVSPYCDACSQGFWVATRADRSDARPLQGAVIKGKVYVFVAGLDGTCRDLAERTTALESVSFYTGEGAPKTVENFAPFDFAGTAANGTAKPWDTRTWSPGDYNIHALLAFKNETSAGCGDRDHGLAASFQIVR